MEKITALEVQQLRQRAEAERKEHARVMEALKWTKNGTLEMPSCDRQMEIVTRQRESEVLTLLEMYAEKSETDTSISLSDEAQVFIYDDNNNLPKSKDYMLRNIHLCYAVEQRIFMDDKPLYMNDGEFAGEFYPKFSAEGEKFIVSKTLSICQKLTMIIGELYFLRGYTKRHELDPLAQEALMSFLTASVRDDKVKTELEKFVFDYIVQYQRLANTAQIELIRSGNHRLIMYYIENTLTGIEDEKVVNVLIERGDKEEVTAYFERYAKED